MMFCWCALVLLTLVPVVTSNNAGVKVMLTQKGLDYVAVNAIEPMLKHYNITVRKYKNTFTGRIQSWENFDPELMFVPTTGVTITVKSAKLHMTGTWEFRTQGPFDLTLSTLYISVTAAVKTDETGNLTLSTETCKAELGDVSGKRGWDKVLEFGLNIFHKAVEEQMCSMMKKTIADYNTQLATLNAKLSEYAGVNFSIGPTVISSDSIEFSLKDIFRTGHQETYLSPTDFTLPSENTKMLYIGISAFTINTLATAFNKSGFLNIIPDDMDYLLIGTDIQFQKNPHLDITEDKYVCKGDL